MAWVYFRAIEKGEDKGVGESAVAEFEAAETHGFVNLDSFAVAATSAGLGWSTAYMSVQSEAPYAHSFEAQPNILISVLNKGPIRGNVSTRASSQSVHGGSGAVAVFSDGVAFKLDLQSAISTTHLHLRRTVLEEVADGMFGGDPRNIHIATRLVFPDPVLQQFCHAVRKGLSDDPRSSALYTDHITRGLSAYLLRTHIEGDRRQIKSPSCRLSDRIIGQVRDLVHDRLAERISLGDLAKVTDMSIDHFVRLFKKTTGLTPYQFILLCRVERAQALLAETSVPIIEIALKCGFSDQMHLTRAFSRRVGQPPAAFRRERQK